MFGLLIAGIFGNIQQACARISWSGTKIYIRSNGDIEWLPSTAPTPPISTTDRVHYDITGDIETTSDGIVVQRDNIIINGNDHTIKGPRNFIGIYLEGRKNVVVMRTTIREYHTGIGLVSSNNISILGNHLIKNDYGIYMESSSNNVVSNIRIGVIITAPSIIESNNDKGIFLVNSNVNTIKGSIIESNYQGIGLSASNDNTIKYNTIRNSIKEGIYLGGSSGNTIQENTITANNGGIKIGGGSFGNTVSGNTIESNGDYGVALDTSTRNTISTNTIRKNNRGIWSILSDDNVISGNKMEDNDLSVLIHRSLRTKIEGNNITNSIVGIWVNLSSNHATILKNYIRNSRNCIRVAGSSDNSIVGNDIANPSCASCGPGSTGIWLYISSGNTISGNTISQTTSALYLYRSSGTIWYNVMTNNYYGLVLLQSNNNNVYDNTITSNNNCGIYLSGSNGNTIHRNNITNNGNGTYLSSSSGNKFWLNNFTNNNVQVYATMDRNYWNTSYPTGGNYWSDYRGADAKKGPNQDQSGSDGIGDTPRSINSNNIDYLPRGLYLHIPPPVIPPILIWYKVNIVSLSAPATASPGSAVSVPITVHYDISGSTHVLARITSGATTVWSYDFGSKNGTGDLSYTATFSVPSSPGSYTYRLEAGYGPSLSSFTVNDSRNFNIQVLMIARVTIVNFTAPSTASAGSSVSVPIAVHYEITGSTGVLVSIFRRTDSDWDWVWSNSDSSTSRSGTGDLSYTATFSVPSSPGSYTYEIRASYQSAGKWNITDRKTFQLQVTSLPVNQTQPPTPPTPPAQPYLPSVDLTGLLFIAVVTMAVIIMILLMRMKRAKPPT
jgi:parallel beta-helix repeat protein